MKEKILLCTILLILFFSFKGEAVTFRGDVSISNYGYGMGLQSPVNEGWSITLTSHIRQDKSYTRTGLRYSTSINEHTYFGGVSHVMLRKRGGIIRSRFDLGVGVERSFDRRSSISIEGGYSTAVPQNYYYIFSLKLRI